MSKKDEKEFTSSMKVITLGTCGVGKSCILSRYNDNTFYDNIISTIGLNVILKEIKLKNGKNIILKLIDTAGQEKYKALSKSYFKNADAVLFIFSINNEKSFEEVKSWIDLFNENYNGRANIPQYIVGNKLDLGRKVSKDLVNEFINENKKYKYFETSAKENIGIKELFEDLAENLYKIQVKENT
jgi:small GTP-binding protein